MNDLSDLSGRTALVTGASGGIGAEFAARLAQRGADLVLVARSLDKLEVIASSLRSAYGVHVVPQRLDLSDPSAPQYLFDRTAEQGIEISFLVNNAAGDVVGEAAKADPASVAGMITVNAQAVVETTIRFLPGMVSRGRGVVVNMSSGVARQPFPYMAAYGASKALLQSFTVAVSAEVAATGVRVLAVCPGVTATGMKSEDILPGIGGVRTPEQVVRTTFRALSTRKPSVVDGRRNTLIVQLLRHLPERAALALAERISRPGILGA